MRFDRDIPLWLVPVAMAVFALADLLAHQNRLALSMAVIGVGSVLWLRQLGTRHADPFLVAAAGGVAALGEVWWQVGAAVVLLLVLLVASRRHALYAKLDS